MTYTEHLQFMADANAFLAWFIPALCFSALALLWIVTRGDSE